MSEIRLFRALGLLLLGMLMFSGMACSGGSDVAFEQGSAFLGFEGNLPSGQVTPTGTTTEPQLEIALSNLEEPEHDFFYVLWAVDTDGEIGPSTVMFIPMEVVAHSGTSGTGHLHEMDLPAGVTFATIDQLLISIEADTDEDGIPEVLDTAGVPQADGPAVAMLFSEDFSAAGGVAVIVEEHIHFGDGLLEIGFEHGPFEANASHAEAHIDYINHSANVEVHDTPLPPPGYHYALWAMQLDGTMRMELADIDLVDADLDGIGEFGTTVNISMYDLFAGIMFMVTLEANEGELTISPIMIFSGMLACAPGHCPGETPAPTTPADGGGADEHVH